MKLKFLVFLLILLIPLTFLKRSPAKTLVTVARVIDGDTLELANGKRIRLLGIDAPEKGQFFYEEARERLKKLVEGKRVFLERDVSNSDSLGRLLRYVFLNNTFINLKLVEEGFAIAYIVPPDKKYASKILEAEEFARKHELGIWKRSSLPYADCIRIKNFHFNALGKDSKNLNDEYVVFENRCNFSINLSGWMIKDRSFKTYVFPEFVLDAKSSFILHSGFGKDTKKDLFWNSTSPIWNNDGDTLFLRDREGFLILSYSY